MKIWIYSSVIRFKFLNLLYNIYLNQNCKVDRSKQSFTGLGSEDQCSSWGLNKVLLVLSRRTSGHCEDWTKFYWSWVGGPVFIVRTEQSFTGLGSEDQCSSRGLNKVLLVLGRRTSAHREDCVWTNISSKINPSVQILQSWFKRSL
jgi:hypothetical protein